jgi:predicted metal-binding membrane protein
MPGMSAQAPGNSSLASAVASALPGWLLMSVAMSLAGVLPAAEHVAMNSFRRKRSLALGVFFAVYLLVWLAAGVPVLVCLGAIRVKTGIAVFTLSLGLAAGYELTGVKRRALNRCHRTSPLPPSGVRGILAVGRFGWINTSGCVASCWLSMIAMLAAGAAKPLVMVALTVATTYGRLARRPDLTRQRIAVGYTAGAMLAIAL